MPDQKKLFETKIGKRDRKPPLALSYVHFRGAGVPGGHNVISDGVRPPFVTSMRECASIELRHSDVVVDIGAYVGTYAIRCARFPVRRVVAYEPTPFSFGVLSLCKCVNLEAKNYAVTPDKRESVDFYLSRKTGVSNSLLPSKAKDKITAPAVSYADAVKGATIVKIDVEGAEYDYPWTFPEQLRAVIVDFHKVGKSWVSHAEAIVAKIERSGFKPVISPRWSHGWTSCGSWLRDVPDSGLINPELMHGFYCCGCGRRIESMDFVKTLCNVCWESWEPKYRDGFGRERP